MKFSSTSALRFSIIIFATGIIVSYLVYISNIKMLEKQIEDNLGTLAFHSMDKIDRMLYERYANIKTAAKDPVIRSKNSTPGQITSRLLELKDNYGVFSSLSFFNLDRIRIADTEGEEIGEKHPFTGYWPSISHGKDLVIDIYKSESGEYIVFHFASIVKDKYGVPFGVIVARMPLERLIDIIKIIPLTPETKENLEIELVNKGGWLLYSNHNKEDILTTTSHDWGLVNAFIKAGKKLGTLRHAGDRLFGEDEEIAVFASGQGFLDLEGNSWTLILEMPTKVLFAPAVKLRNTMIIFSVISAFSVIIIYLFSHLLLRQKRH